VEPEEGDLLLFPTYLYHAVEENLSDNNRIVISFNVDIDV
jgi:ectoine hydroxylase-related dioxygenase (phytanoyl-CoA dioxygenase family)